LTVAIAGRLLVMLSVSTVGQASTSDKEVVIYHDTQVRQPSSTVGLAKGDALNIRITHTIDWCYTYNLTSLPKAQADLREAGRAPFTQDVLLPVVHDGKGPGYRVAIKKRSHLTSTEKARCWLPEVDFDIPVETLAWSLGFAGAFTGDGIPQRVYFLEKGTKRIDNVDTSGFFVRQNKSAEDRAALSTAAMIHLFHSDPDKYSLLRGFANWAPVSFGLAVGSDSKAKYLLGSSLRFDDHLYLTAGLALGPSPRLPNSLDLRGNNFTTEATALDSLPSRTGAGWFIGVSYTFLGKNLANRFSAPFATPPAEGGTKSGADGDDVTASAKPKIEGITPDGGQKAGEIIVLSGTGFKPAVGAVKVQIATTTKNYDAEIQSGATDTSVSVKIPAEFPPGEGLVTITAGDATSDQTKYIIK
jgi:hypothetical protein